MTHPSKRLGSRFEAEAREYLRSQGVDVEHLRTAGAEDEGDLYALDSILELKAEKRINLSGYLKEAKVEAENYAKHRNRHRPAFFAVVKARGKNVSQSYAVTTLEEWARVMKKLND